MTVHKYRHVDYDFKEIQVASDHCRYYAVYRGDTIIMRILIDEDDTPGGDDTVRVVYINPGVENYEIEIAYWRVRSMLFLGTTLNEWFHVMKFLHQRYYESKENLTPARQ